MENQTLSATWMASKTLVRELNIAEQALDRIQSLEEDEEEE